MPTSMRRTAAVFTLPLALAVFAPRPEPLPARTDPAAVIYLWELTFS
ncbi:hypothetical protein [Streptosporangium roseum]